MKKKNPLILCVALLSLTVCACESTEPTKYPPPKDVINMQGIWEFNLSARFQTDSTAYNLYIKNGIIEIGETKSKDYPYYFHTSLDSAILSSAYWEVPLENISVVAYRALIILGLNFSIESPLGIINFECSAGWDQTEKTEPSRWNGRVYIDDPSTDIGIDGRGTFTADKK